MTVTSRRAARALVLVFALAATAVADKVVLNDGRTYEGVVLEETDTSVRFKTAKAVLTFPRKEIASLERSPVGPLQERETRLGVLDPGKPAEYLAAANWLVGPGRGALDLPTLRRLCTIAAKFDRAHAWEAQMLLAKETEAAGLNREAGTCLARAEIAKPGQAETKSRIEKLRTVLMREAQTEMEQLQKALTLLTGEQYEKALPGLRKARTGAMSERAPDLMGMSMEQLVTFVARRVKCEKCNGQGELPCPLCEGRKESECADCEGTGTRKDYKGGGREVNLAESACKTCHGLAKLLCPRCDAERDVIVFLAAAPTQFTIRVKGGSETATLQKEIDFKRFTHQAIKITMILAEPPRSGGTLPCTPCEGIKFDSSAPPLPMEKLRAYREEVAACLIGTRTYDPLPVAEKAWDPAVIADEMLRYRNGRWAR